MDAGGVLEANNAAHGRHGVPVALLTAVNAGAYNVDGLAACWGRVPIEPCTIAWFIALK